MSKYTLEYKLNEETRRTRLIKRCEKTGREKRKEGKGSGVKNPCSESGN